MLTTLAALFALGTIGFWSLLLVIGVGITILVENEEGAWATFVAIASMVGLSFLWKLNLLVVVKANPGRIVAYALAYFAIGAAWSIFKWFTFLHKANSRYEDYKADFLTKNNAVALNGELAAKLMDEIIESNDDHYHYDEAKKISSTPPLARNHKASVTRWATYWPFSILGFFLNDIVRKTWTYIVTLLQGTYQRISNYVFRGASADQALAQEFKAKAAAAGANSSDLGRERSGSRRMPSR